MKNKLLKTLLLIVIAVPMVVSVFAADANDLLAKLDKIAVDISEMKEQYNDILATYPDVINSLSPETKAKAEGLADNLMAEDIASTVETLKAELTGLATPEADKVLEAIETLESDAEKLIDDNKDVVEDLKAGVTDLTVNEVKQVMEKVTEIVGSLGMDADVSDTYAKMMKILEDAHGMFTDITTRAEAIIDNNVATFEAVLTKGLLKELLAEVKSKDVEAIIDTLIEAVKNTDGAATLKQNLKDVKAIAVDLKDKLLELTTLPEQDLLMFTDAQKKDVANKIKAVEKDFIDFTKAVIDNSAVDYMDVAIDFAYTVSVDTMVSYANKALDYYEEYKDTIDSLSVSMFTSKIPQSMKDKAKDLAKKAALFVALGFVDTSDYNRDYITNNFQTQIDNMAEYIVNEIVEYRYYIEETMYGEIDDAFYAEVSASVAQDNLRAITGSRFNTLASIKALKARVDAKIPAKFESVKEKITQVANNVYGMYNDNIAWSIISTLIKENQDEQKTYEYNEDTEYIVTNKFISTSNFTKELGVPDEHKSVVSYQNTASNKVRTGTTFIVDLSDSAVAYAVFAVLGDVYADGLVDARDYMVIKNHIMVDEQMSEASGLAADTYRDGLIDARDYMAIKNYIMNDVEISL